MGAVDAFPPHEEGSVEDLMKEAEDLRKCAALVSSLGQRVLFLQCACLDFAESSARAKQNYRNIVALAQAQPLTKTLPAGGLLCAFNPRHERKRRRIAAYGSRLGW